MIVNMKFTELGGLVKSVIKDTVEFSRGSYACTNLNFYITTFRKWRHIENLSSLINHNLYETSEHYRRGSDNELSMVAIPIYPIIAAKIEYKKIARTTNNN